MADLRLISVCVAKKKEGLSPKSEDVAKPIITQTKQDVTRICRRGQKLVTLLKRKSSWSSSLSSGGLSNSNFKKVEMMRGEGK